MTPPTSDTLFCLPSRRIGVDSIAEFPRAAAATAWLIGPGSFLLRWQLVRGDALAAHRAMQRLALRALRSLDVRLEIEGMQIDVPDGPFIIAPLHESLLDPALVLQLGVPTVFAARSEFLDWVAIGPIMKHSGQIIVDPERPRLGYRKLLETGSQHLTSGSSLTVFPQGSVLGIEAAFHPAAFQLAQHLRVPLLPVVISGSHTAWEYPFSPRIRFGRRVRMEVLPPVPPDEAVAAARDIERQMRENALARSPQPRRYVPERDGWWDGHRFEIDPDFSELAEQVRLHRIKADGAAPRSAEPHTRFKKSTPSGGRSNSRE